MSTIASQITSLTIVHSTVYSGADQRKHQSSASLAFVRGIHRGPVNSSHKGPVTRKTFPFDDVIMTYEWGQCHAETYLTAWSCYHLVKYGLTLILEFKMATIRNFEFHGFCFFGLNVCDTSNKANFMLQSHFLHHFDYHKLRKKIDLSLEFKMATISHVEL